MDAACIEARDLGSAFGEVARAFERVPDLLDPVCVSHRLAVMRLVTLAIEVPFSNHVCGQVQRLCGARENLFDHEHALRPAKTPECGLRGLVGSAHASGHVNRRQFICVVHMKHRAPHDGLRQVEAPPAVGKQFDAQRVQASIWTKDPQRILRGRDGVCP